MRGRLLSRVLENKLVFQDWEHILSIRKDESLCGNKATKMQEALYAGGPYSLFIDRPCNHL